MVNRQKAFFLLLKVVGLRAVITVHYQAKGCAKVKLNRCEIYSNWNIMINKGHYHVGS